jgi:hypothetical protein
MSVHDVVGIMELIEFYGWEIVPPPHQFTNLPVS